MFGFELEEATFKFTGQRLIFLVLTRDGRCKSIFKKLVLGSDLFLQQLNFSFLLLLSVFVLHSD